MGRPAKTTTPFPSVLETAKRFGVSKRHAKVLAEMAQCSERTGQFAIPDRGRSVRGSRTARVDRDRTAGGALQTPTKLVAKFRAIVPANKK